MVLVIDATKARKSDKMKIKIMAETFHFDISTSDGQSWVLVFIAACLIVVYSFYSMCCEKNNSRKHITL
jgi:hypothetical protein